MFHRVYDHKAKTHAEKKTITFNFLSTAKGLRNSPNERLAITHNDGLNNKNMTKVRTTFGKKRKQVERKVCLSSLRGDAYLDSTRLPSTGARECVEIFHRNVVAK